MRKSGKIELSITVFIILYILFYFLTVPKFLFLRSDDFGYIDSLVLSIKHNNILTSQFLEPPNLLSTFFSLSIFKLTFSMYLSVWLPVFISSAFLFYFLILIFRKYSNTFKAILFALTVMTLPSIMNITFDATGVVTSWLIFVIAILVWERRFFTLFFILAFLASINRQSNIILYLLPVYYLIKERNNKERLYILVAVLCSLIFLFILFSILPKTLAQKQSVLNPVFLHPEKFINYGLTAFVYGWLFLILSFCFSNIFFLPETVLRIFKKNLVNLLVPLSISVLFLTVILFLGNPLHFQTPILNINPLSIPILIFLLFVSIWIFPWKGISFNAYLLAALFYIVLNSARGLWYDYYFFEVFILAFFYFKSVVIDSKRSDNLKYRYLIVIPFLFLNSLFYFNFKYYLDLEGSKVKLYEKALREEKIDISSIGDAPFGYLAWKLFYNYHKDGDKPLTGFMCYLKKDNRERAECEGNDKYLSSKTYEYKNRIFPLDDSQWREFLNGEELNQL